jgi:hypothetical protein
MGAFNFGCRGTPCGCPGRVHPQVSYAEDPPLQPILNGPKLDTLCQGSMRVDLLHRDSRTQGVVIELAVIIQLR